MGNAQSAEAAARGRRASHKLSKPHTGNVSSADLLNPNMFSSSKRQASRRRDSMVQGSLPTAPVEREVPVSGSKGQVRDGGRSESRTRHGRDILRSLSSHAMSKNRDREGQGGASSRSRSMQPRRGTFTRSSDAQVPVPVPSPVPVPTPASIDPSGPAAAAASLSPTQATFFDSSTRVSQSLSLAIDTKSPTAPDESVMRSPTIKSPTYGGFEQPDTSISRESTSLPRAASDLSLYTPMMRRRSLMTPGIATRTPMPPMPPKSKARYSLPSTPARRDSSASTHVELFAVPAIIVPEPARDTETTMVPDVPRAVTPSDDNFQQIGAYKFGSLHITNGSPTRTPGNDAVEALKKNLARNGEEDYFRPKFEKVLTYEGGRESTDKFLDNQEIDRSLAPPMTNSQAFNQGSGPGSKLFANGKSGYGFLNDIHYSPMVLEGTLLETMDLQTTSKHSAMEDDLFDDTQLEASSLEIPDDCEDPEVQSQSQPTVTKMEADASRELSRSDSGIVASPMSERPFNPLIKADSGYSSNVSVHSYSRTKAQSRPGSSNQSLQKPRTSSESQTRSSFDLASPTFLDYNMGEDVKPPVPGKDATSGPSSQSDSIELLMDGRRSFDVEASRRALKSRKNSMPSVTSSRTSSTSSRHPSVFDSSSLSPTSSVTSTSTTRSGVSARKQGKFHRMFSSAKRSHLANAVRREASDLPSIPSIPADLHARLDEHNKMFPTSSQRLALRAKASQETLQTIFSVNSIEILGHNSGRSVSSFAEIAEADAERAETSSPTDSPGRFSGGRRTSVARKPLPIRKNSEPTSPPQLVSPGDSDVATPTQQAMLQAAEFDPAPAPVFTVTRGPEMCRKPIPISKTRNLTIETVEETDSTSPLSTSPAAPTPTLVSHAHQELPSQRHKLKSPPPISMQTRRSFASLQSQTPEPNPSNSNDGNGEKPSLSRRASRESIHSYPSATRLSAEVVTISRRSSVADLQAQPPTDAPPIPPMSPKRLHTRRSVSFNTEYGEHRIPNWEVQTDHAVAHSGSSARSRAEEPAPSDALEVPRSEGDSPLRHRASYDGHSRPSLQRRSSPSKYVFCDKPPFIRTVDSSAYVADPWSGVPMPQQLDGPGQHPPKVQRGHTHNRSFDQSGKPSPYRVLHSYDSPAYRHVPIWG